MFWLLIGMFNIVGSHHRALRCDLAELDDLCIGHWLSLRWSSSVSNQHLHTMDVLGVMSAGSNGRPFLVIAVHFSNLYICLQHSGGRYPIWFNSMFEFCQKMIHSIFDSILLYPRFNSKYYSILKKIADSIQKIIQFNSQGIIDNGRIGRVPKKCPK